MKKLICSFLLLSMTSLSFAQEDKEEIPLPMQHGKASVAGSINASTLALVACGVLLAAGIIVLFILLEGEGATSHS